MKSIRGSYKKYLGYIAFTCLLAILPLRTGVANAASVQSCGQWNVVPSPNSGTSTNHLFGVKVLSSTDVWAVGNMQNNGGGFQTLIEHWDGTQWSFVTTPPPPPNVIYRAMGVAVASANDIWMVGDSAHEQNPSYQTLTEFYC